MVNQNFTWENNINSYVVEIIIMGNDRIPPFGLSSSEVITKGYSGAAPVCWGTSYVIC
jgi:hypothetical protein